MFGHWANLNSPHEEEVAAVGMASHSRGRKFDAGGGGGGAGGGGERWLLLAFLLFHYHSRRHAENRTISNFLSKESDDLHARTFIVKNNKKMYSLREKT